MNIKKIRKRFLTIFLKREIEEIKNLKIELEKQREIAKNLILKYQSLIIHLRYESRAKSKDSSAN